MGGGEYGETKVHFVGAAEEVNGEDGEDAGDKDEDHERRRHGDQRCGRPAP